MKIALVTKKFNPNLGGAERYAEALAKTFTKLGHEVHIVTPCFSCDLPEGVYSHVPNSKVRQCLLPGIGAHLSEMQQLVSYLGCDIVYALTLYYPADMYRAGDGIFKHWLYLNHPHPLSRWVARILSKRRAFLAMEKRVYREEKCKAFITNSQLVKRHITQYYGVPSEKIHVVYNGVDHEVFYPAQEESKLRQRRDLGIPEHTMMILFVGNNWKRKGLETLLRGAVRLIRKQEARIFVIGRGKAYKWSSLIRSLRISEGISFIHSTPKIADWYRIADVMALPTHYDPFANVCLEAMACGIPAITTYENGVSEIIEPGKNGFILPSIDGYGELESHLASLRDRDFLHRMSREALQTARRFTLEENAHKTLRAFSAVANLKSPFLLEAGNAWQ